MASNKPAPKKKPAAKKPAPIKAAGFVTKAKPKPTPITKARVVPPVAQKPQVAQRPPMGRPAPVVPNRPVDSDPLPNSDPLLRSDPMISQRPMGAPNELTQMPTYVNDPSKLTGNPNLTPFRGSNPLPYQVAALDPNMNPVNNTPFVQQQTGLGMPQVAQTPGMSATGDPVPTGDPVQKGKPGDVQPMLPPAQGDPLRPVDPPARVDPSLPVDPPARVDPPINPNRPVDPQARVDPAIAQRPPSQGTPQVAQRPGLGTPSNLGPGSKPRVQNPYQGDPLPNSDPVQRGKPGDVQPMLPPALGDPVDPLAKPQVGNPWIAQKPPGFEEGGFTGDLPENKPAGIVHGGEYVFPADVVDALGIDFLENLKNKVQGGFQEGGPVLDNGVPGYATGGSVLSFEEWKKKNARASGKYQTPGHGDGWTTNAKHAYEDFYLKSQPKTPAVPQKPIPAGTGKIVANEPKFKGQINVQDYGSTLIENPKVGFTKDMQLGKQISGIDENAKGTNISKTGYNMQEGRLNQNASKGTYVDEAQKAAQGKTNTYQAKTTIGDIYKHGQMTAAQGKLSEGAIIDPDEVPLHDIDAHARGETELGKALGDYAQQDLNAVDPKATMRGQLQLLQDDFVDPVTGEPKIPGWAAATARGISRLAAFKGMTGSAATAAMSQAMMEASLPIAQQDAQFFQTLTIKNLDNKQASIINKANVLAKMELTNVDNRMAAVIQNSKNFMEMDMKNLDNRQQAQILNQQARVQSIFEDAKAVNTQRMFTADSQNEMDRFYDELGTQVEMFNSTQRNNMTQFNVKEVNSMRQFNAQLENQREQFEKTMSYNIDVANAKWRQTVTLTEADQKFQAAATDVRNMVDMSTEQLNRLWDRSDNLLQFIHTSSENEADRKAAIAMAKLKGKLNEDAAEAEGWGTIFGTVAGKVGSGLVDWLF